MIATTAATSALPNQRVGTIERSWRQDEPVLLSQRPAGPEAPFATLDDAITGAAYMSRTGKHAEQESWQNSAGVFAITRDGDAFRAQRLLVPEWKSSWGVDRQVDTALLRAEGPVARDATGVDLTFETVRETSYGSERRRDATGTLRLDPAFGAVAIVGEDWAFVDGQLRPVEGRDPFPPPPPPPPPPPLGGVLKGAVDKLQESIALIETVPITDTGDAATKQARIGAYDLNMAAQGIVEDVFLRDDVADDVVSTLRTADAFMEDANWQLAKKPSPDGRFNGVDIPGALRDSRAALELLQDVTAAS